MLKNLILATTGLLLFSLNSEAQDVLEQVKDINTIGGSDPGYFHIYDNQLFFRANNGEDGTELWVTDGTEEGTQLFKDINPNGSSTPIFPLSFDGQFFFSVDDGEHGRELWISDGTPEGTELFKDINPDGSSFARRFTEYGDKLVFEADDGTHSYEMWITDGTPEGTEMVKDINDNPDAIEGSALITEFFVFDGLVYFGAFVNGIDNELWVSDGTTEGTEMVLELDPIGGGRPSNFTAFNDEQFFFRARDGAINGNNNWEIWISDGTAEGTEMVRDIHPDNGSNPSELLIYNQLLYFTATDGTHGRELWKSDGTEEGTQLVVDINPDGSGDVDNIQIYDDMMYFTANNGENGNELWKSDGTEAGTEMVIDLNPEGDADPFIYEETFNGQLVMAATDGSTGVELWFSDGTASGTEKITPEGPYPDDPLGDGTSIMSYNGELFLGGEYNDEGIELWKVTDPTIGLENVNKPELRVFPSPAGESVQIEVGSSAQLRIVDSRGRLIRSLGRVNNKMVDVSGLQPGLYFLLSNDKGVIGRFVKK